MKWLVILLTVGIILLSGCATQEIGIASIETETSQEMQPNQDNNIAPVNVGISQGVQPTEIKTFSATNNAVCKEDGKPIIRLFSTTWCPHCQWIKDTFDSTVQEYVAAGKIVAYHWEIDIDDDTLTTEIETEVPQSELAIFEEFNPRRSIPTFVFGCKYYRIGNGYESQNDLEAEIGEFKAVIEALLQE